MQRPQNTSENIDLAESAVAEMRRIAEERSDEEKVAIFRSEVLPKAPSPS